MQELNMQEIEQVGGAGTLTSWIEDAITALKMVGQLQETLVETIVDVACTATTECR